jgi:hypothetical protein
MSLALETIEVSNKRISFGTNKAGEGVVIVSQKRLGQLTGLKGSELKTAHYNYRIEAGKAMNAGLSACMANGDIIGRSMVPTKSGELRVIFTQTKDLVAPADKTAKQALLEMAAKLVAAGKFSTVEEAMAVLA